MTSFAGTQLVTKESEVFQNQETTKYPRHEKDKTKLMRERLETLKRKPRLAPVMLSRINQSSSWLASLSIKFKI